MKIALISTTGSVGKTTLAVNLFAPRMPVAEIISVESLNETAGALGVESETLRADQFQDLIEALMVTDNAIVDIGASNVETFLTRLIRFKSAHAEIDYFVIPVIGRVKEQQEALNLVSSLAGMKVPAQKIRIVFNQVIHDPEEECEFFLDRARNCVANPACYVEHSDLFEMLGAAKTSIPAVLADKTDYKAAARAAKDKAEARRLARKRAVQMQAEAMKERLDVVFKALFAKAPAEREAAE